MMDANDAKRRPLSEIAAEWFIRLKDGDLTAAERRKYLEWLKKSPEHITEMLEITRTFGAVRDAYTDTHPTQIPPEQASNIIDLATREVVQPQVAQRSAYRPRIAVVFAMVAVSSLLALFVKGGVIDRTIETEANEWRSVPLADGSMLRMGPRTRVNVKLGDAERVVELETGEAFFEVMKDPRRPFIVRAQPVNARAVGTAFGVTRYGGSVKVTVREGIVAVSQSGRINIQQATEKNHSLGDDYVAVTAGQRVSVARSWPVAAESVDVEREFAWLHRRLSFARGEDTVGTAVAEFNRRNRVQIVIVDPALEARSLDGVFDANDPESLVRFIEKNAGAGVVVMRGTPGVLRVEMRRKAG